MTLWFEGGAAPDSRQPEPRAGRRSRLALEPALLPLGRLGHRARMVTGARTGLGHVISPLVTPPCLVRTVPHRIRRVGTVNPGDARSAQ